MFYSSGYFKHIDCPFLVSGLCERHYCHFRHHNYVKVESFPSQITDIDSYSFNDNYLSSINDNEYNPVDFVTEVKPSYSPAPNPPSLPILDIKSSQLIQNESVNKLNIKVRDASPNDFLKVIKSEKLVSKIEIPPVVESPKKSKTTEPCKSSKAKRRAKERSPEIPISKKRKKKLTAKIARDIYNSIYDSDDSSSSTDYDVFNNLKATNQKPTNQKSPIKVKHKPSNRVENDGADVTQLKKESIERRFQQIQLTNSFQSDFFPASSTDYSYSEMEDALVSGRIRSRRITVPETLKFRMVLAERDRQFKI